MTKATIKEIKQYVIVNTEDYTSSELMTEKDVINYCNSMINELNKDVEECDIIQLAKNINEASARLLDFLETVIEVTNKFNPVIELCNRAINNNAVWHGKTKQDYGYYNFAIKPLYFVADYESIMIQIRADKMCNSGISDNGIRYVKQYEISKHIFTEPQKLVKYLVQAILRGKTETKESRIEYIEF